MVVARGRPQLPHHGGSHDVEERSRGSLGYFGAAIGRGAGWFAGALLRSRYRRPCRGVGHRAEPG